MEFDDHANHVNDMKLSHVRIWRIINFNSIGRKDDFKCFALWFLRALRVLRVGLTFGRLSSGQEIATEPLPKWNEESFTELPFRALSFI